MKIDFKAKNLESKNLFLNSNYLVYFYFFKILKRTHMVSNSRFQIVLNNLDAIQLIHPVSDQALFETTLNLKKRTDLVRLASIRTFNKEKVCEAARQGYKCSDKAHVFYQLLNGVSGFLLYYYSFETFSSYLYPSRVDEDDSSCQP